MLIPTNVKTCSFHLLHFTIHFRQDHDKVNACVCNLFDGADAMCFNRCHQIAWMIYWNHDASSKKPGMYRPILSGKHKFISVSVSPSSCTFVRILLDFPSILKQMSVVMELVSFHNFRILCGLHCSHNGILSSLLNEKCLEHIRFTKFWVFAIGIGHLYINLILLSNSLLFSERPVSTEKCRRPTTTIEMISGSLLAYACLSNFASFVFGPGLLSLRQWLANTRHQNWERSKLCSYTNSNPMFVSVTIRLRSSLGRSESFIFSLIDSPRSPTDQFSSTYPSIAESTIAAWFTLAGLTAMAIF